MVTPYFTGIHNLLVNAIRSAETSIDIAVAWFTNEHLFEALIDRLDAGVSVRLVMINDDINIESGLDFQRFIDKGGQLFLGKNGYLMHNKYCIIDNKTVYTGSYNYTYFAENTNFENIVHITGEDSAVALFTANYNHILAAAYPISNLEAFLLEHPYTVNSHESRRIRTRYLYQKARELSAIEPERSKEIIEHIEAPALQSESFIIREVMQDRWNEKDYVQQIIVNKNEVLVDVEIVISGHSFFVFGPRLNKSWHITNRGGKTIPASSIQSIAINNNLIEKEITDDIIYIFHQPNWISNSVSATTSLGKDAEKIYRVAEFKEPAILSARIVFPKGDYINETINLYEGDECAKSSHDFWHFLNVNMKLCRE